MAERKIIGVDFSGAGKDNQVGNTWVTEGRFDADSLAIDNCYQISRTKLEKLLSGLPPDAVAALDFPFGVPQAFAKAEFDFEGTLMHEMWEKVSNKLDNNPQYIKDMKDRLGKKGELRKFNKLLRQSDSAHFPDDAFSPLNPASPQMFPMTFRGMKMLHALWTKTECKVPPLDIAGRAGPVLLETMPRLVLKSRGLPYENYKNNKGSNVLKNLANRQVIFKKLPLPDNFGIVLRKLKDYRDLCVFNDDALDSIVAAVAAALWAKDKTLFHRPEDHHDNPAVLEAARRDGCIYAPKLIKK